MRISSDIQVQPISHHASWMVEAPKVCNDLFAETAHSQQRLCACHAFPCCSVLSHVSTRKRAIAGQLDNAVDVPFYFFQQKYLSVGYISRTFASPNPSMHEHEHEHEHEHNMA